VQPGEAIAPDDAVHVLLTSLITAPGLKDLRFDLSDEFSGTNATRPCVVWQVFRDFFDGVTDPHGKVEDAVETVQETMSAFARGVDPNVTCEGREDEEDDSGP